jgi:hypothetical protein
MIQTWRTSQDWILYAFLMALSELLRCQILDVILVEKETLKICLFGALMWPMEWAQMGTPGFFSFLASSTRFLLVSSFQPGQKTLQKLFLTLSILPSVDTLSTTFLKENRWNLIASPTLSSNGLLLLFGVRANSVRAWTGALDFTANANVALTLDVDSVEPRMGTFFHCSHVFSVESRVFTLFSANSQPFRTPSHFRLQSQPFSSRPLSEPCTPFPLLATLYGKLIWDHRFLQA